MKVDRSIYRDFSKIFKALYRFYISSNQKTLGLLIHPTTLPSNTYGLVPTRRARGEGLREEFQLMAGFIDINALTGNAPLG
jgi:hypothetical protein